MSRFSEIATICHGTVLQSPSDNEVEYLVLDSRKVLPSPKSLFLAIKGVRNDGHEFIQHVYDQGIRMFVVEKQPDLTHYPDASFIQVGSSLKALQQIATWHRNKFNFPVIGITGSNGKTIVKEWLFQMLSTEFNCVKNPGSYNSQVGVPLSVWQMNEHHTLGIFEAGISQVNEMQNLQSIIKPTIGIFTNLGSAHSEGFSSDAEKVMEKAKLFHDCETVIYCSDYDEIHSFFIENPTLPARKISWGQKAGSDNLLEFINDFQVQISGAFGTLAFALPFTDKASKENVLHCIFTLLHLGYSQQKIQEKIDTLRSIPMRLELKQGINQCLIIDDTYNNDLGGLRISLDFLGNQFKTKKTLILSDVLQSGQSLSQLSQQIAALIEEKKITKFIGIGFGLHTHQDPFEKLAIEKYFYLTTDDFLKATAWDHFTNEAILIKGARVFQFERIVQALQKKVHGTVMEIDLGALVHNLNYFRSLLRPQVKIMVMIKAFAYGSGSNEVAGLLQYHRVDYLGVAYADEGVDLRMNRIRLPIMVMNPSEDSFQVLLDHDLEPEVYSLAVLQSLILFLDGREMKIHLKIDTGMHRLGFERNSIDEALVLLKNHPNIRVASVFSHLAASDEALHDGFTNAQVKHFRAEADAIEKKLGYRPLKHILNSSGILRFPDYQEDMVRLGIGLYGVDPSGALQDKLRPVPELKTIVSQVKTIPKGETVGYGRKGKAEGERTIATIAIGYADGFLRAFGQGRGAVSIRGRLAPVMGNVCMDMTMVDVTGIPGVAEGDEVIIFGEALPIQDVARRAGTIPYEILTNTSERVKRVFYAESI